MVNSLRWVGAVPHGGQGVRALSNFGSVKELRLELRCSCSCESCVCQILMAAARAANFRPCQILKELRFGPLPNFTMRSSCVWRGELPHSICSIWANENCEQDTRSEKDIFKCLRFELFEVLNMFLFSGTKLGPLILFPNFGTAAILIFSQISYIIYIESEGRKWKKNELFTL